MATVNTEGRKGSTANHATDRRLRLPPLFKGGSGGVAPEGKRSGCLQALVALLCALVICLPVSAKERRPGIIKLTDGKEYKGQLWFTNASMRFYEGDGSRKGRYINCTQDELASITFKVRNKFMENRWRFKDAGSDEKEILPGKYPVINLASVVALKTGKKLTGHLMAKPVYIRWQDGPNPMDYTTSKFFMKYQYKGKVGQTYDDIIYVKEIRFTDVGEGAVEVNGEIVGKLTGMGKLEQVTAYGINRGHAYKGKVDAEKGTYTVPDLPKDVYDLAVLTNHGIFVGLSDVGAKVNKKRVRKLEEADEGSIAKELTKFRDFFDQQEVVAVKGHREAAKVLIHQRRVAAIHGQKKLGSKEIHRLGIWRWHLRTTEWHIDSRARANLFRYHEEREGLKRGVKIVPKLGGIDLDPEKKKRVELNHSDSTVAKPSGGGVPEVME